MILHVLFDPFGFGFMRRALAGCVALSLAAPPLGVFLVLRRMSLTADVLQHGILPGIAIGAALGGLSLLAMGAGGLAAGLLVAVLAGWLARATKGREDSQFAALYLIALGRGRGDRPAAARARPHASAVRQRAGGGRHGVIADGRHFRAPR